MIRKLLASRRRLRKEKNYQAVSSVYDRGKMSLPAESLIVHQPSDPERVAKIRAEAEERRQRRNRKRLSHVTN